MLPHCVLKAMASQGIELSKPVLHRTSHGTSGCSALQMLAHQGVTVRPHMHVMTTICSLYP